MTIDPDQPRMEHDNSSRGIGSSGLDDMLAGQVLETRTILMFGEFTPALAQRVSQQLLLLASRSSDDIKLLVNAQGGQASDGEALFDLLRGVEPRVLVIGAGAVAGAPALAFVAPPRAERFCLPHARFSLFQRLSGGLPAGVDLLAAAQPSPASASASPKFSPGRWVNRLRSWPPSSSARIGSMPKRRWRTVWSSASSPQPTRYREYFSGPLTLAVTR
jgi:ATP-dependent Clp protease, protease subunit